MERHGAARVDGLALRRVLPLPPLGRRRLDPVPGEDSRVTALVPVFASTLGKIFQPVFQAMAWLIAFFYALVPNYAIAIALLTVVVMIVTAPLTVKSTKSMVVHAAVGP